MQDSRCRVRWNILNRLKAVIKALSTGIAVILIINICGGFECRAAESQNYLKVPWKGSIEEMKKVYPDAALAEETKLKSGKTFSDYRINGEFDKIPMETAFLFYDGVLFRIVMRYKNFHEPKVLQTLVERFGNGEGNVWKSIFTADDNTIILLDTIDDTVTITDRLQGSLWEVDHQKTMQDKGHLGQYGGG